nr:hypothetical protein Itr_chr14CG27810 [Ipomoea trifida]GMD88699.1 hypothetical protein Iba_chr14cCG9620 [Ipomoea batatas]GMD94139.1 hypothetical protein Iba_chr14fCG14280 [Ipomoea batatas]
MIYGRGGADSEIEFMERKGKVADVRDVWKGKDGFLQDNRRMRMANMHHVKAKTKGVIFWQGTVAMDHGLPPRVLPPSTVIR